jgi:hypothetical protein
MSGKKTNVTEFPRDPDRPMAVAQDLDPRAHRIVAEINELVRHWHTVSQEIARRLKRLDRLNH